MIQETCDHICTLERERFFMMKQRISAYGRLGAYIRIRLGWTPDLPEAERKKLAKETLQIIKDGHPDYDHLIEPVRMAAKPFEAVEEECIKKAGKLARKLPVWSAWGKDVVGFGENGLAVIVGEAGNLDNYPSPAQLRKRLGLAVLPDGKGNLVAQGRLGSNASAEDWIAHGYNPERRSRMHAYVGKPLMNQGPYRALYLRRRELETTRSNNNMHEHLRAHRYMECVFVKHLWKAWHAAAA